MKQCVNDLQEEIHLNLQLNEFRNKELQRLTDQSTEYQRQIKLLKEEISFLNDELNDNKEKQVDTPTMPKEEPQKSSGQSCNKMLTTKPAPSTDRKKFVLIGDWPTCPTDLLSPDAVEYIHNCEDNLSRLNSDISQYRKELLIITEWKSLNYSSGFVIHHRKMLSKCKEWETLRPADGKIYCIATFQTKDHDAAPEISAGILSYFTKFYYVTHSKPNISTKSFAKAIPHAWPRFANLILSEDWREDLDDDPEDDEETEGSEDSEDSHDEQ